MLLHLLRLEHGSTSLTFPDSRRFRELTGLDDAALHHGHEPRAVIEQGDVSQHVAVDDEQVGELACFDGSELAGSAHDLGPGLRGTNDRFERAEAYVRDEEAELLGVVAVWV